MRTILFTAALLSIAAPLCASDAAFQALLDNSNGPAVASPSPEIVPARADGSVDLEQYRPPITTNPVSNGPGIIKVRRSILFIRGKRPHI